MMVMVTAGDTVPTKEIMALCSVVNLAHKRALPECGLLDHDLSDRKEAAVVAIPRTLNAQSHKHVATRNTYA